MNKNSLVAVIPEATAGNLVKVPFVEMAEGRLQGVISSGSSIERVYVSFFKKDSHNYYCSTNNNRPCGGLRGSPCKHLTSLMDAAINQYGAEKIVRFLKLDCDPDKIKKGHELLSMMSGIQEKEPAATVFSRFLNHLSYLELDGSNRPIPEMSWFFCEQEPK